MSTYFAATVVGVAGDSCRWHQKQKNVVRWDSKYTTALFWGTWGSQPVAPGQTKSESVGVKLFYSNLWLAPPGSLADGTGKISRWD